MDLNGWHFADAWMTFLEQNVFIAQYFLYKWIFVDFC